MILKNYLITALRHFWRNRLYAFINIFSLAIGVSASVLIFMYLRSEWRYDTHHPNADRIFRVPIEVKSEATKDKMALNNFLLPIALKEAFPTEIQDYFRILPLHSKQTVSAGRKKYNESYIAFADPNIFELLRIPLEIGDARNALKDTQTVVITDSLAIKYFGSSQAAMGKVLQFPLKSYTVTGVMKSHIPETHIRCNAFLSNANLHPSFIENCRKDFMWLTSHVYIKLANGVDAQKFEHKINREFNRYAHIWVTSQHQNEQSRYLLQPIRDIHLEMGYTGEITTPSNPVYLYILSFIGIFILLMACINYMNLATARAGQRSREVGLRKVLGASRRQLFGQFLGESFAMTVLSIWLGLAISELLLPNYNYLTGKVFHQLPWQDMEFWGVVISIAFGVSFLSGLYPALYLSSFPPTWVLQNKAQRGHFGRIWLNPTNLRKSLVILQFALSISMMIGTLIAYSQWDYMRTQPLGFDKHHVTVLDIPVGDSILLNKIPEIRKTLLQNPQVVETAIASMIMDGQMPKIEHFFQKGDRNAVEVFNTIAVDRNYISLLNIQMKEGVNFPDIHPDSTQPIAIINEMAARKLGWDKPVGKLLGNSFLMKTKYEDDFDTTYCEVIGVVKDFHYRSLQHKIEPLVMLCMPRNSGYLLVKTKPENTEATQEWVRKTWEKLDNKHPIESFNLAEYIESRYEPEGKLVTIFGYFSLLAIIISGLGLLGLTSYLTEQRTKEIGIRRVLGASAGEVVRQFAVEFVWLVLLAFLLASPVVYTLMLQWLENFAYHSKPSASHFLLAGITALCMAVATVSWLTWGVARRKPGSALRYGG